MVRIIIPAVIKKKEKQFTEIPPRTSFYFQYSLTSPSSYVT